MKFIKKLLFLILLFSASFGKAQVSELGGFIGMSGYKGELNMHMFTTDINIYHPAFGIFWRRNTNAHWAYRFNFMRAKVSGYDSHSPYEYNKLRNLSFSSPIYEIAFLLEFNFFPFERYGSSYWATPYVFAGYSAFYFNPTSQINGEPVRLRPYALEGTKYSPIERAIPMGVGLKVKAGKWILAGEIGARRTTTDYLDNVSGTYLPKGGFDEKGAYLLNPSSDPNFVNVNGRQRGNSRDKDWYVACVITVSRRIGNFRKNECERLLRDM